MFWKTINFCLLNFLLTAAVVFGRSWNVVVGEFDTKEKAQSLLEELKTAAAGRFPFIVYGHKYTVMGGEFDTFEKAKEQSMLIKNKLGLPCRVEPVEKEKVNGSESRDMSGVKAVKLIDVALEYLGTSYVYGGMSSRIGLDCSGLVKVVFAAVGISVPRNVASQIETGKKILSRAELKPGDIVFFRGRGLNSGSIEHVGIYLGRGDFIHAEQSSGKVRIDNLQENRYYLSTFACGRRLIE